MKKHLFVLLILLISNYVSTQNIPLGSIDFIEDRLRNEQLLGNEAVKISFALRPLSESLIPINEENEGKDHKRFAMKFLPLIFNQQLNTSAPMGRNDGAMIPAKGYQMLLSPGVYVKYGKLSIQIRPEYVFADNPNFETFPTSEDDNVRLRYIRYLNFMDNPERFGDRSYQKLNWGQSNISLTLNKFTIGLSSENLWWGPGRYNSLIMSNNAPGFLHFSLKTKAPIQTRIGNFEGQLISGKLTSSGFDSPDNYFIINGINQRIPEQQDWRYLSGLSINYQPKWVPGLFLGINRVFQIYEADLGNGFSDYFPVITPFQKKNLTNEDGKLRDQVASIFLRWVFKESKSEIYFEYGYNDHKQNIKDLSTSPSHSNAILVGFGKIFNLNSTQNKYLKFNFEHTQLQQSADRLVRPAGAWYEHGTVRHGYTNMGQVMGAGIGPGGNSQTVDFSMWSKGKVVGLQFERLSHNLDFFYDAYSSYDNKWVDLNISSYAYKRFGNIGIQGKINTSFTNNYQWQLSNRKNNFQLQVSVQYHLQ